MAAGAAAGMLFSLAGSLLGLPAIPLLRWVGYPVLVVLLGALAGATRARWVPLVACGLIGALLALVSCTPFIGPQARRMVRRDLLQPVEAVVALSGDVYPDGRPTAQAQARFDHACDLLRAGWARRLVVTRLAPPKPSYMPALQAQLARQGLDFPVEEAGAVRNTHDEAVAVARLAQERGWSRVILVTDPLHTRRAAANFEKAGLRVLCSPGARQEYNLDALTTPLARRCAFRDWLYENYHTLTNRLRGWL